MFELTLLLLRAITVACRGHHDVVLENLALRHQLRTLQRRVKRPHLRTRDRMFWVLLATAWRRWRSALVLVHPETVVADVKKRSRKVTSNDDIAKVGALIGWAPARTLEDMIRDVKRGIWVSRFWYTRTVHPLNVVTTGMTRDGTFLVEDGRVTAGIRNFRFNQSVEDA